VKAAGLYLDEDVQSEALIESLRARGHRVLSTTEAGLSKATDEDELKFATSQGFVLATCNIADFARIHSLCLATNTEHGGIILIPQQKWGPGELARRITRLLSSVPGCDLRNRMEFISNW
jgi:hypothetical protein